MLKFTRNVHDLRSAALLTSETAYGSAGQERTSDNRCHRPTKLQSQTKQARFTSKYTCATSINFVLKGHSSLNQYAA